MGDMEASFREMWHWLAADGNLGIFKSEVCKDIIFSIRYGNIYTRASWLYVINGGARNNIISNYIVAATAGIRY